MRDGNEERVLVEVVKIELNGIIKAIAIGWNVIGVKFEVREDLSWCLFWRWEGCSKRFSVVGVRVECLDWCPLVLQLGVLW